MQQQRPPLPADPQRQPVVVPPRPAGGGRARLAGLDGAVRLDLDVLDPGESTELLARIAGPRRVAAEPDAAAAIVALCGHLPLAVRVAGARLAVRGHWRLADLAELLADERHRLDELAIADIEVRAGLALSYEGLDGQARRLFRRLGLLAAPTFAAWVAAAVLDLPLATAQRLLDDLVDAHLVEVLGADASGQVRHRFHDLVRLFARERADAEEPAAERRAVLARALGAWLALAGDADPALAEGNVPAAHSRAPRWRGEPELFARLVARPVAWFESERSNLLAGIGQASRAGLAELAWDLAVSSASYFQMVADQDWREAHELADAAARASGDTRGQAALLLANGWVRSARTRPAELIEVFARAGELFQRVGDLAGVAAALLGEGNCLRLTGRQEQAMACFERARTLAAQAGAPDQEAAAAVGIAMVDREQGHLERAQEGLERVLPVWRDRSARRWEGETVQLLGLVLRDRGDLTAALAHIERALTLAAELDDRQQQLMLLIDQAELRARLGDRDAARDGLQDALRRAEDLELLYHQARALLALGDVHAAEGRFDEAVACLTGSVRLWRRAGIPRWLAVALLRLASAQEGAGDPAAAADARGEADRMLATMATSVAAAVGRLHRLSHA